MMSRISRIRRIAGLAVSILIVSVQFLVGQTSTSIISGTVTDSSGAVVSGAQVNVKNVGTGIVTGLTSDAQGRFRASEMIIGDYEVQASHAGFQTVVRKGITTTVGGEAIVDIALAVGQSQQVVTVDAQVSQVDTTTSAISNTVTRTQIEELPMGSRNQTDLLGLAPGVGYVIPVGGANYGKQDNYSISGARPNGILFLIDNTNLETYNGHSTGSGATGATLGLEAIGDYQTLTNTYSAQFGGNGGLVNAASKSGTNNLHGSAYFYLTNSDVLTARSPFATFIRPGDTIAKAPPSHKGLFGGSLGGPIQRNKAFYFANYEGIRQGSENESIMTGVPDINAHAGYLPCATAGPKYGCNASTGLAYVGVPATIAPLLALFPVGATTSSGVGNAVSVVPTSSQDNYLLTRFDYTFSARDSLFVRYVRNTALALTLQQIPLVQEADRTANHFVTIEEDHVISPTLINLARISFLRPYENAQNVTAPIPALQAINIPGATQGLLTLGNKLTIGSNNLVPYRMAEQTYQVMDDVIWTHGAHNVKFGGLYAVVADFSNQGTTGANWAFGNILGFLTAQPTSLAGGLPGHLDDYRDAISKQVMPYVNDEWKFSRRLTLNLGVRYEWLSNPGSRHNLFSNITSVATNTNWVPVPTAMPNNPSNKNFAPRVGFAFDPFADHKTSIRGGYGIFYNELTAHVWLNAYWTSAPYLNGSVPNPAWPVPFSGGATPVVPNTAQFGLNYMSKMHTPYMQQYNLSIQHEIAQGTIFSAAYVGSKGTHLLQAIDQNFPVPVNGTYGTAGPNGTVTPNIRPNPNFGKLYLRSTAANSNYNSLQLSLNRRFANHFQTQVAYTFQKSMDIVSGDQGPDSSNGGNNIIMDPFAASREHARSNFDFTHVLKINGIYEMPFTRNEAVKGWRLSGVITAQSGEPFTIFDGFDETGSGQTGKAGAGRPNLNPGGNANPIIGSVSQWFDPSQFTLNPVGTFGNLGRNTAVGPRLINVNVALLKRTTIHKISEHFNLEFRAEITNLFNHPNYGLPDQNLYNSGPTSPGGKPVANPSVGQITSTITGSRVGQLALKATF